ncbi:hypothetical protein C8A03DRAFT_13700, partial [Achaetomium macrosporum]
GTGTASTQQSATSPQSTPKPAAETVRSKSQAELDEDLKQKLEGIAGDGGASGVEYEDGRPVTMKRSVRENMFRYI